MCSVALGFQVRILVEVKGRERREELGKGRDLDFRRPMWFRDPVENASFMPQVLATASCY